ncbi:MAG: alpha/beta fold hydrolase [Acidobacteria bacterium]|nr:alpha/beta fold hydrolase [Acidobacteriota bacterium]
MEPDSLCEFLLPAGYHRFHKDQLFNFQLNRPYSLGYARREDLVEAGRRISSFADWKAEMTRQAETALAEDRVMNAAFHYRAAEFYTFPDDPDKVRLYDLFAGLFYRVFAGCAMERTAVPYDDASLPAITVLPAGRPRGAIVLHGGYDSFIEEFFSLMTFFAAQGYLVVGFDGPGQGAARRQGGLLLDYRWERPVGAVLDHFGLDDVTLIGLSMGGWFALRAAAFEPRVRRVIVSGHAFDYRRVAPAPAAWLMMFFRNRLPAFTNRLSRRKIRQGGLEAWSISHLMYITGAAEPVDAIDFAFGLNEANLHSEQVTQDVLVMASRNDHFIPFRLHEQQVRRLTAARSVTERVFTRDEHAHNHCQMGNLGLALRVMAEWIDARTTGGTHAG